MDEYSNIYYSKGGDYKTRYAMSTSERPTKLTIKANDDGTYTIGGVIWVTASFKTNARYYKYTYNDFIYDPFSDEPSKTEVEVIAEDIKAFDYTSSEGYVELDLNATSGPFAVLAFKSSTYNIPAGTYKLDNSGEDGTFMASTGMDGYYAIPSYVETMGWPADDYFLRSGSITVAYEGKTMSVTGTATSAHGSTITIDATGTNPFYVPEPETYTLDVSSVVVTHDLYDDSFFGLTIGATNDGVTCNGFLYINSSTVSGEYDDDDIRNYSYFGDYMNTIKEDPENSLSIVATGNKEDIMAEYKLNLRLRMYDNNIYVVKDALLYVEEPVEPTPYDDEPEADTFTFELNIDAEPDYYSEDGVTVFTFKNSSFDKLAIAFPVSSVDKVTAGTYTIDTSKEEGTVIASPGCINWIYQPTLVAYGIDLFESTPYFLTSGTVQVEYSDGRMVITGTVTSAKGSTITLNVSGIAPNVTPELPGNVLTGYLDGAGMEYFLAYDVTTNSNGSITVAATLVLDEAVIGLQPQVVIDNVTSDMSYDDETGECGYTTSGTYTKGDEIEISFNLHRSSKDTATKSFKYTVE